MDKPKMRKKWRHINRRRSSQHKIIDDIVWELIFSLREGSFLGGAVQLLCIVVLVSAIPPSTSAIRIHCQFLLYHQVHQPYVHIYPLSFGTPSLSPTLPFQVTIEHELSSLCYTAASHQLCFTHGSASTSTHISQFFLTPSSPFPHDCSPHLHLCSCPTKRFICTIFLDSTYMH